MYQFRQRIQYLHIEAMTILVPAGNWVNVSAIALSYEGRLALFRSTYGTGAIQVYLKLHRNSGLFLGHSFFRNVGFSQNNPMRSCIRRHPSPTHIPEKPTAGDISVKFLIYWYDEISLLIHSIYL
jgi:hypothetical protein